MTTLTAGRQVFPATADLMTEGQVKIASARVAALFQPMTFTYPCAPGCAGKHLRAERAPDGGWLPTPPTCGPGLTAHHVEIAGAEIFSLPAAQRPLLVPGDSLQLMVEPKVGY